MVDEMRCVRTELDNQRHFTKEDTPIQLVRDLLEEWTGPPADADPEMVASRNAMNLKAAADADLFEMG